MVEILTELPSEGTNRGKRVLCRCHCGKEFIARKSSILSAHTTGCGCKRGRPKRKPTPVSPKPKIVSQPKIVAHIPEPEIEEEENNAWELLEEAMSKTGMDRTGIAEALGTSRNALDEISYDDLLALLEY